MLAIWIAYLAAALAIPRPVAPREVPVPTLDRGALAHEADQRAVLASAARSRSLPYEVRAVGELLRRYGKAGKRAQRDEADQALTDLRRASRAALERHGVQPLLELRAVQTELFLEALSAWERGQGSAAEIEELSGNLLEKAKASSWIEDGRLIFSRLERAVFFEVRWADLTGLRQNGRLAPSLDDWRVYYAFLIEHPEAGPDPQRLKLGYVQALAKRDPTYPVLYARGVLQYQIGAFEEAAEAFGAHLAQPGSLYPLRARNYMLGALARAQGAE